jgi:hypothetical protein
MERSPPAPLRVFPLEGRSLWPGKAGSTVALEQALPPEYIHEVSDRSLLKFDET